MYFFKGYFLVIRKLTNFPFRLIFIFDEKEPQRCQFFTDQWKALFGLYSVTNRRNDFSFFNMLVTQIAFETISQKLQKPQLISKILLTETAARRCFSN